ncbi:sugar ABC transporter permease [Marinitoga sp. 38H-ov]|uniref:sugar ABC transporter permease n=1 Tax=Marinitoga sp. 38H-ov TaxID=1755814 RepID=UPI0013ED9815|nr:sugar ABC transporter permease [Marinitoga sp. 38H-ov]KAF2956774.1 sugar ABC transporter permease [Marinitoga sp. 38H-ov]
MNKLKNLKLKEYMMVIALISIWIIFGILTEGFFLNPRNLSNLFRQSIFISLLAIGMVWVIVLGEIDLSVGSVVGLSGGLLAILDVWKGLNPILSFIIVILLGALVGIWNGFWTANRKIPAFIVTLGGMLIFRGILVGITKGTTIGPLSNFYEVLGKGYIDKKIGYILGIIAAIIFTLFEFREWKKKVKYNMTKLPFKYEFIKLVIYISLIFAFVYILNSYRGIPIFFLVMILLLILFLYVSNYTVFGRYIYASGGNKEAAIVAGINVKKITFIVFIINGIMAALAGIFLTARLDAASVASGQGAELDAIAACVIGGTSLMGGIGNAFGAVIGAIVMASLDNGMSLMNVPMFWQSIIKGLVLIFAVWFDIESKKND